MSGGCLALSQEHLAVGTADGRILLTVDDGPRWRDPRVIEAHRSRISALAWCADNRLLASGAEDGSLLLTSVADGRAVQAVADGAAIGCLVQVPGGDGLLVARAISVCCFSPDGSALVSAGEDGAIRLLRIDPLLD